MTTLDLADRLSALACLLLILTMLISAPLVGIGENRLLVSVRHDRAAAVTTAPKPLLSGAQAAGAAIAAAPAISRADFVCVDFVCVNRSTAVPNLFDYSPATIRQLRHFESFSGCVEQCVASTPEAGTRFSPTMGQQSTTTATTAPVPSQPAAAPGAGAPIAAAPSATHTSAQDWLQKMTSGSGLVHVGNRSLDAALAKWIAARHDGAPCDSSTPVYFAPFSPNGIGNKVLAVVMAFHMALMQGRRLVVSDWPPSTLDVSYPLAEFLEPSSCQAVFDADRNRPRVRKCTVISCPINTRSSFRNGYTQPHWAHMSALFLDLPREWAHLEWLDWWRAITQYLLRPGDKMLTGLSTTLSRVKLLHSPGVSARDAAERLRRATSTERADTHAHASGFAARFAGGVAAWTQHVRRPLVGVHVRLGDGCWDSKRGGCKYVKSFSTILTRLRESGVTSGTIFLATDNSTIAAEAVRTPLEGFDVIALGEDRMQVEKSHARGERRREGDELLHLQLLDLALLSQTDVLAGVFGSTFVKTALQLGHAKVYLSLDTFPWCPLLRCYWGWRDMCHNCELCYNSGGGGEACNNNGYHTAGGLRHAVRDSRTERGAFRRFIGSVDRDFRCRAFSDHPLTPTIYDRPVVGAHFAPTMPPSPPPVTVCAQGASTAAGLETSPAGADCTCGFRRFHGVDNARFADAKPAYGYGNAIVPPAALERVQLPSAGGARPTLRECERLCCDEPLCHSIVWRANTSTCIASLAIAHGARVDDWCWHPTASEHAITSIRLPGAWQQRALDAAQHFLQARTLVRTGPESGPRTYTKAFHLPVGHSHPMERHVQARSCDAERGGHQVSDIAAGAVALSTELERCRAPPYVNRASAYPKWRPR